MAFKAACLLKAKRASTEPMQRSAMFPSMHVSPQGMDGGDGNDCHLTTFPDGPGAITTLWRVIQTIFTLGNYDDCLVTRRGRGRKSLTVLLQITTGFFVSCVASRLASMLIIGKIGN